MNYLQNIINLGFVVSMTAFPSTLRAMEIPLNEQYQTITNKLFDVQTSPNNHKILIKKNLEDIASQGHLMSILDLWTIYKFNFFHWEVEINPDKANFWIKSGAELGHPPAQRIWGWEICKYVFTHQVEYANFKANYPELKLGLSWLSLARENSDNNVVISQATGNIKIIVTYLADMALQDNPQNLAVKYNKTLNDHDCKKYFKLARRYATPEIQKVLDKRYAQKFPDLDKLKEKAPLIYPNADLNDHDPDDEIKARNYQSNNDFL